MKNQRKHGVCILMPVKQVYGWFTSKFFETVFSGLLTAVPNFYPTPMTLFGENTTEDDICDEVSRASNTVDVCGMRLR